jgi:hypothetical protein
MSVGGFNNYNNDNMKISRFKVYTTDRKMIIKYLKKYLPFEYQNHSSDMSILANEDLHLRTNSSQMDMVILKIEEGSIDIDVIGGAGGVGILNINWGSEKEYIKGVRNILLQFSEEFNIKMEEK